MESGPHPNRNFKFDLYDALVVDQFINIQFLPVASKNVYAYLTSAMQKTWTHSTKISVNYKTILVNEISSEIRNISSG